MFVEENIDLIAESLGIEADELEQLSYNEGEHASKDGMTYYYYIIFDESNPAAIMQKIVGLGPDRMVQFPPSFFDTPDDDYNAEV